LRRGRNAARLARRPEKKLRFASLASVPPQTGILLDTCVYIDGAADRLPDAVAELLVARLASHSSVCLGELAFGLGMLNPQDSRTKVTSAVIGDILERIAGTGRIIEPDGETWMIAGTLAGMAARLLGYGADHRRKALADALILLSARKAGLTVLTANITEFDLLQQLFPDAQVAFYRAT
jgi:predicted nucleic acid-binding protein